MPLSLSPATLIDGPSIAPIAADAFMAESFTHALFPGQTRTDQIEGFIARWPKTVSEPNTRHFVVRDTETGEVVGWSDWLIQMRDGRELGRVKGEGGSSKGGSDGIGNGKMEVEEEKVGSAKEKGVDGTEEKWPVAGSILKEAPNPPKGMNNALQISFGKKIQAMREKHLWGRPALFLCMLGTSPVHQRRGAASLHMQWAHDLADREGLVCWSDASPGGVAFYRARGYEAVDEVVTELGEWTGGVVGGRYVHTGMMRFPKEGVH